MAKKDCTPLATLVTELARDLSARPEIKTLDDVVFELRKEFPILTRESIIENVLDATSVERRTATEEQRKWQAIRRDMKSEKDLRAGNDRIQEYLDKGELPERQARTPQKEGVLADLRAVRDSLKKKLAQSEPAVKQRLDQQIADVEALIQSIEDGTYEPPVKEEPTELSKEVAVRQVKLKMLRQEAKQAIDAMQPRPVWQRLNPLLIFHDIMFGGEFSYILRQGGASVFGAMGKTVEQAVLGKPTAQPLTELGARLRKFVESLAKESNADTVMQEALSDPRTAFWVQMGLHISPWGPNATVSELEEFALSQLGYKVPIWRAINRAGVVWLNLCRIDACNSMAQTLAIHGEPTLSEARVIVNAANQGTGRGYEGGGAIGDAARLFVSWQYVTSRFKLLTLQPIRGNWQLEAKQARIAVAREYGRVLLGLGTLYALAYLAGADIETDPRSSDFLKWRFERHRVDPMMGLQQFVVFAAREFTGKRKAAATGKVTPIRGPEVPFGRATGRDLAETFLESKFGPIPAGILNVAAGKQVTGEPTNLVKEVKRMSHPITYNDIYHAMEEDNVPVDMIVSILSVFGMGMQTFQPEEWQQPKRQRR